MTVMRVILTTTRELTNRPSNNDESPSILENSESETEPIVTTPIVTINDADTILNPIKYDYVSDDKNEEKYQCANCLKKCIAISNFLRSLCLSSVAIYVNYHQIL